MGEQRLSHRQRDSHDLQHLRRRFELRAMRRGVRIGFDNNGLKRGKSSKLFCGRRLGRKSERRNRPRQKVHGLLRKRQQKIRRGTGDKSTTLRLRPRTKASYSRDGHLLRVEQPTAVASPAFAAAFPSTVATAAVATATVATAAVATAAVATAPFDPYGSKILARKRPTSPLLLVGVLGYRHGLRRGHARTITRNSKHTNCIDRARKCESSSGRQKRERNCLSSELRYSGRV